MIDPYLVNNVHYDVAGLEGDKLGPFNPVPWTFRQNNTVQAAGHWNGQWLDLNNPGVPVIRAEIEGTDFTDGFDVYFLGPTRFIAVKGGMLYRLGKRAGT
jgi:hypothetical protein